MSIWPILLLAGVQANIPTKDIAPFPKFADGVEQIGLYTPVAQLLDWCSSTKQLQLRQCNAYISGVVEASGMIEVDFPQGPIDTMRIGKLDIRDDIRKVVIDYIDALPKSRMSEAAARVVYEALVARYPYIGAHKAEIPYRPKNGG